MQEYSEFFTLVTGLPKPFIWQATLGGNPSCTSRLLRIPTGIGKTQGVLAAWLYHRVLRDDDAWPRRLVWCLPMRTLVEQTSAVAEAMLRNLPQEHRQAVPGIAVVMGGQDPAEWYLQPDQPMILIGTQDMLLSRALNRGYASGRARCPRACPRPLSCWWSASRPAWPSRTAWMAWLSSSKAESLRR